MKLLIVPRWSGSAESDFYRWMQRRLLAEHPALFRSIDFAVMANPPLVEDSVKMLKEALQHEPDETIVMGHSVGFQAAMRAVSELSSPVAGLFGVASWWTVDQPWPSILPWVETPFDTQRAAQNATKRLVLLSDNDPFTADHQTSRRLFEERLSAEVKVFSGCKHFNQPEEPDVFASLVSFANAL